MVTITRQTMELFLKEFHYVELVALYSYYKYIAEEQGTNTIKCTTEQVENTFCWGTQRVRKYKKALINMGLIDDLTKKDKYGKIIGHFIQIK